MQTLENIDVKQEDLESELSQMKKKHDLDKDELEYVGLIEDSIRNRKDMMTIEVCFKTLIYFRFGSAKALQKLTSSTR